MTCEADAFEKRKMCVNISEYQNKYACVAQLVVQLIRNEQVAGSSPVTSSTQNRRLKLLQTPVVLLFYDKDHIADIHNGSVIK